MTASENPFENLPGFKETIARIANVPADSKSGQMIEEFIYVVKDEFHKINYRIISPRKLSPADVRKILSKSFNRTDAWPNDSGDAEIRV